MSTSAMLFIIVSCVSFLSAPRQIAESKGPSGPNFEYVFRLEQALQEMGTQQTSRPMFAFGSKYHASESRLVSLECVIVALHRRCDFFMTNVTSIGKNPNVYFGSKRACRSMSTLHVAHYYQPQSFHICCCSHLEMTFSPLESVQGVIITIFQIAITLSMTPESLQMSMVYSLNFAGGEDAHVQQLSDLVRTLLGTSQGRFL